MDTTVARPRDDGGVLISSIGLPSSEAEERLVTFGPNELPPLPRDAWFAVLGRQFLEPMSLLLIGAAVVAGLGLGEQVDAVVIQRVGRVPESGPDGGRDPPRNGGAAGPRPVRGHGGST